MADSGTYDQATLQRRAKIAQAMLAEPKKPITHWAEGLNELAKGAIGGYQLNHIDELAKDQRAKEVAEIYTMFGQTPPAAKPAEPSGFAKIGSMLGFGGGSTAAAAPDAVTASPESPAMTPAPQPPVTPPVSAPMGGSAATAMASSPDANLPRGYRNMNPGNIEDGPFARSQPGYAGSDGRFAKFASLDNGTGAMSSLLDSYGKRGLNTVNGIINRWAPSSDGNNVNAYAANVAQQLGIGPDDPIPPELRPKLIAAMAQHENGMPLPSGGQPAGAPAGVAGAPPATGGANPVAAALANPAAAQPTQAGILGNVPADKKAQIAKMLTSTNPTMKALGMQMLGNYTKADAPTDEIKEYNLSVAQAKANGEKPPSFIEYKTGLKKAGKPETTINNTVNPILKGVGDRFNDSMEVAKASIPQIQGIFEARRALDQGAITGLGSDPKLFLGKAANLFGLGGEAAQNTEVLRSSIGNSVLAKAKTLGANPSNADRDYIEKVVGGSIALEEGSIRRLLDMQERWARDAIKRANADGKKLLDSQPDALKGIAGLLQVEEPADYQSWSVANPVSAPQSIPADQNKINGLKKKYGLD